jgi:hypothetical protein
MLKPVLAILLAAWVASSCGGGGAQDALASAYEVGEASSALALEASESDRAVLAGLKFDAFEYQGVQTGSGTPSLTRTCGVRYQLPENGWGIVPGMTYSCTDAPARQRALQDAPTRLEGALNLEANSYEDRLRALRGPSGSLGELGPALVSARTLGVEFDVAACVDTVTDRLAEAVAAEAALQCETFLAPGPLLDDFRRTLNSAEDVARRMVDQASQVGQPVAMTSDVAARCGGATASPQPLMVPASVSGDLASRGVAYAMQLAPGQTVEINLMSTAFDALIRLYDSTCAKELASNDDGGSGSNSRLRWTGPGQFVVVATAFGSGGRGSYTLTATPSLPGDSPGLAGVTRAITVEQLEAAKALVDWVKRASNDDVQAAWRGTSGAEVQLACLHRARFESSASVRTSVASRALSACTSALKEATAARRIIAAREPQ